MNFDDLMQLMTGLYRFIPVLLTLIAFTALRKSMRERIYNPFSWNSEWGKWQVQRENRDKCITKNVIKRWSELKNIAGQVLMYNSKNFHGLNKLLALERTMNELGKPLREKNQITWKKSKNRSQNATCEQKPVTEKANICSSTILSIYPKVRVKKFYTAKPLAFSLHFLFRSDQNHYSNLTSKIIKMCEQILRQRPKQFKFFELQKRRAPK